MTEINAVLFDYGMVLSGPAHPPAWAHMQTLTGLSAAAFDAAYWAPRRAYDRGDLDGRAYWQAVSPTSDASTIDLLVQADTDLWTQPNPPMLAWAKELQMAGIRTGILSNLGDLMTEGVLSRFDFSPFHHRTWSHRIGYAKPEPEIYTHAIAGLETPPEQILFLDDRLENIEAARAAGLETLLYTTHAAFESEMRSRGLTSLLQPAR
jgi:putative hydrolase of the HAD superfamily